MITYFGKEFGLENIPSIKVGCKLIERVSSYKILGVIFSDDLTWNAHVSYILN